jgi:hypothetical protein
MRCAIIIYFANRNHPKFKPHLNSIWSVSYKKNAKIKKVSNSLQRLSAKTQATSLA